MYICLCRGVSDKEIQEAIEKGHNTLKLLAKNLNVATQCGTCKRDIIEICQRERQEPGAKE